MENLNPGRQNEKTTKSVETGPVRPGKRSNRVILTTEIVRFLVYSFFVVLIAELMKWDATIDGSETKFSESTYVEYLQSILLVGCSVISIILYLSDRANVFKQIFNLIFGLTTAALIREQDIYFEQTFGHGAWPYAVLLVLAFVVYNAFNGKAQLLKQLVDYAGTKSYAFMIFGSITVFIFSRLYGRTKFWQVVMEEKYFRSVKNASEECIELYGYLFIFFAVIELIIQVRQKLPSES
jgi:hypothetical protein